LGRKTFPYWLIFTLFSAISAFSGCGLLKELRIVNQGRIVAAPGMTFDEVRKASSLELPKGYRMDKEVAVVNSTPLAFDFELAGTNLRFRDCYFYSMWTRDPDPGLNYIQIQVDKNISWETAKKELVEIQDRLKKDGFTPVVLPADGKNAEQRLQEALAGQAPGYSVGFGWTKGNILFIYTARRSPYAINGEDPNEGSHYEVELEIRNAKPDKS
jgi:hypothetical protein